MAQVVPELLPKSTAFAVFREVGQRFLMRSESQVSKAATIPMEVKRKAQCICSHTS